jgi:hypothetical protein
VNILYFLKKYPEFLLNDKQDDIFENLKLLTGGTTSARIGKLLNFAVSQMEGEERYVEVGVFTGATLCSAAYVNEKICIGIDNYLPDEMIQITGMTPEAVKARCLANIRCISNERGHVRLIEKSFRDVTKEEIGGPVAVSFIDGKHDYAGVMDNLEWLEPMLADHAILVFDDVNYVEVSLAIEDWMGKHPENYDMLAYIKPAYMDGKDLCSIRDRFLNNGVCIIRYHRNPLSNTFAFSVDRMGWTREDFVRGKKE